MPMHEDDGRLTTQRVGSCAIPIYIPPPGRRLDFITWCRVWTNELRRYLPTASASTNGLDRVTWRYNGQMVVGTNDAGCYRTKLDTRFGFLQDFDRHKFTAVNFAKTLRGHFDAELSVAD